ncbi:hypothetical protein FRC12_024240 [Ceratobasidium sp. 428]|nr:hypothetical protein FRC12_024240 [Ceratobasidium sp. 428]
MCSTKAQGVEFPGYSPKFCYLVSLQQDKECSLELSPRTENPSGLPPVLSSCLVTALSICPILKTQELQNISVSTQEGQACVSVCVRNGNWVEKWSEEAVYLGAGMLMSGCPSVIATMWSVRDQDAPVVMERVYARLLEDGKASSVDSARALHAAVAHLRQTIGEDQFAAWVPFIHVGL